MAQWPSNLAKLELQKHLPADHTQKCDVLLPHYLDPVQWHGKCFEVGGANITRDLGPRSRGREAPPRTAVGRAGGGCREGVAPSRQGGPGV